MLFLRLDDYGVIFLFLLSWSIVRNLSIWGFNLFWLGLNRGWISPYCRLSWLNDIILSLLILLLPLKSDLLSISHFLLEVQ